MREEPRTFNTDPMLLVFTLKIKTWIHAEKNQIITSAFYSASPACPQRSKKSSLSGRCFCQIACGEVTSALAPDFVKNIAKGTTGLRVEFSLPR